MAKFVQTGFVGGEITDSLEGRVDFEKQRTAVSDTRNVLVEKFGGLIKRTGTELLGIPSSGYNSADPSFFQSRIKLVPFRFSSTDSYVLAFVKASGGNVTMHVAKDGAFVNELYTTVASHYNIATPFNGVDLEKLRWVQDADNLYFTHPEVQPQKLTRTADDSWTFTAMSFPVPTAPSDLEWALYRGEDPESISRASNQEKIKYAVTAVDEFGNESELSDSVEATAYNRWEAGFHVRLGWTKITAGTVPVRYNVYKNSRGYWGFIGAVEQGDMPASIDLGGNPAFRDDRIEENVDEGPPSWPTTPFQSSNEYPGCCAIFEQRLFFARSNNQPNTVWASQPGDFENFSESFPLRETDSVEATVFTGEVNEILHLVPQRELAMLTSGAEWIVSHGDNVDAITPTSVQFKPHSRSGSGNVIPVKVGHHIIFVDRSGKVLRDLTYDFGNDGFSSKDLTVLAPHLFENYTIVDMAYQQSPNSTIWVVRSDGALLSLAYIPDQDVWAWTQHDFFGTTAMKAEVDTDWGFALSVAVVPNIDGNDDVYVAVARLWISSGIQRFTTLEKLTQPVYSDLHTDGTYLDCSMRYSGASTTTPTFAADTLVFQFAFETKPSTVAVVADGRVLTRVGSSPSDGEYDFSGTNIVLGTAASEVVVGIPYTSHVETLPMSVLGQSNAQGRRSRPTYVTIKAKNTRGLNVGYDSSSLVDVNWNDVNNSETTITPKTRDQKVRLMPSRSLTPRLYFESDEPSPFNILSFIAEVEPGD